nr:MAG TPA: hypothetical protein [Caudoviricetes sp.]
MAVAAGGKVGAPCAARAIRYARRLNIGARKT